MFPLHFLHTTTLPIPPRTDDDDAVGCCRRDNAFKRVQRWRAFEGLAHVGGGGVAFREQVIVLSPSAPFDLAIPGYP